MNLILCVNVCNICVKVVSCISIIHCTSVKKFLSHPLAEPRPCKASLHLNQFNSTTTVYLQYCIYTFCSKLKTKFYCTWTFDSVAQINKMLLREKAFNTAVQTKLKYKQCSPNLTCSLCSQDVFLQPPGVSWEPPSNNLLTTQDSIATTQQHHSNQLGQHSNHLKTPQQPAEIAQQPPLISYGSNRLETVQEPQSNNLATTWQHPTNQLAIKLIEINESYVTTEISSDICDLIKKEIEMLPMSRSHCSIFTRECSPLCSRQNHANDDMNMMFVEIYFII